MVLSICTILSTLVLASSKVTTIRWVSGFAVTLLTPSIFLTIPRIVSAESGHSHKGTLISTVFCAAAA